MGTETLNLILTSAVSLLTGGGVWAWISKREDKRKTPYDMMVEMLEEQRRFYKEKNAEMEAEKLDSAEKSAVIQKSQRCKYKYQDPSITCPVDEANESRLEKRCERCGYGKSEESNGNG